MMDRLKKFTALPLSLFIFTAGAVSARAEASGAVDCASARAAFLAETETGQVLYEYNADERLSIASVTKVMTLLIAAEEIEKGSIDFETTATCSDHAASMDGSVIWLSAGEEMSVGELIKAVVIASANDACVMLAEAIEGSEAAFVERMNETAARLGMTNTHFANCVGYDDPEHYSTARDVAKMSAELRRYDHFDEFLLTRLDSVRTGTKTEVQLLNTNKLITRYDGITGLKTGTTDDAGCCLAATARRGEMGLTAVVLGCTADEDRFDAAEALLDYGFSEFEVVSIHPDPAELLEVAVEGGVKPSVDTRFTETGAVVLPKGSAARVKYHYSRTTSVSAPVTQGQLLGFVTVTSGDTVVATAKVIAAEEVEELDFGRSLKELVKKLFEF
ncbi:MAG: D-alanyl-D-alanine carboxypeptidase [Bacteroides sp.]|nr:D-alanyl-D-alanine carboxypeptidase [Eubacterium sp.]MCM1419318.1 D-alanyl-D-alanine carboxypeptidase [Roseburia sp.]MCM1463154.1 D-alanyl-D-alanine carboxypeptidase [Bacteroides sp.]